MNVQLHPPPPHPRYFQVKNRKMFLKYIERNGFITIQNKIGLVAVTNAK